MMTEKELEQVILDCLEDIYNAKYIGKLKVEIRHGGYLISLGLETSEAPYTIYTELDGEALIKFLKQDFRNRRMNPNNWGYIQRTYLSSCNNVNKKCCDTR